jgi:hypothetical protein
MANGVCGCWFNGYIQVHYSSRDVAWAVGARAELPEQLREPQSSGKAEENHARQRCPAS